MPSSGAALGCPCCEEDDSKPYVFTEKPVAKSSTSVMKASGVSALRLRLEWRAKDEFISIEEVARRLHADVPWVREKIRRRSPNPMPVHNLGRHLVFDWVKVVEWVRSSPRPVHAAHKRRKSQRQLSAASSRLPCTSIRPSPRPLSCAAKTA